LCVSSVSHTNSSPRKGQPSKHVCSKLGAPPKAYSNNGHRRPQPSHQAAASRSRGSNHPNHQNEEGPPTIPATRQETPSTPSTRSKIVGILKQRFCVVSNTLFSKPFSRYTLYVVQLFFSWSHTRYFLIYHNQQRSKCPNQ
jgi:hypothetical protein